MNFNNNIAIQKGPNYFITYLICEDYFTIKMQFFFSTFFFKRIAVLKCEFKNMQSAFECLEKYIMRNASSKHEHLLFSVFEAFLSFRVALKRKIFLIKFTMVFEVIEDKEFISTPKWLNEQFFKKNLRDHYKTDIEVMNFDVKPAGGENYSSSLYRVEVTFSFNPERDSDLEKSVRG